MTQIGHADARICRCINRPPNPEPGTSIKLSAVRRRSGCRKQTTRSALRPPAKGLKPGVPTP